MCVCVCAFSCTFLCAAPLSRTLLRLAPPALPASPAFIVQCLLRGCPPPFFLSPSPSRRLSPPVSSVLALLGVSCQTGIRTKRSPSLDSQRCHPVTVFPVATPLDESSIVPLPQFRFLEKSPSSGPRDVAVRARVAAREVKQKRQKQKTKKSNQTNNTAQKKATKATIAPERCITLSSFVSFSLFPLSPQPLSHLRPPRLPRLV